MKTDIGLGRNTDVVYRTMLQRSRWTVDELCDALGWDDTAVRAHVNQLRGDGLLVASVDRPDALRAVEPALALPAFVVRCFRKVDEDPLHSRFGGVQGLIALRDRYTQRRRDTRGLHGFDDMAATVERFAASAHTRVTFLLPQHVPGSIEFSPHLLDALFRKNIRLRPIWARELMGVPEAAEQARRLDHGSAAPRYVARVPVWAVLIDHTVAITIDEDAAVRVEWDETNLANLSAAADHLWTHGTASRQTPPSTKSPESSARLENVLCLLSNGLTDDAVARKLGVSVRTVRNDVASTMKVLESRSRFQAGAAAARLGLI